MTILILLATATAVTALQNPEVSRNPPGNLYNIPHLLPVIDPTTQPQQPQQTFSQSTKNLHFTLSRRQAFGAAAAFTCAITIATTASANDILPSVTRFDFHNRDRNNNQNSIIREDYWYILGKTPPQALNAPLAKTALDDPQWNAFGSCETSGGTNSCTYVSLKQRIPAYSKYASSILYGAKEFQALGRILYDDNIQNYDWRNLAAPYLVTEEKRYPPGPMDAELKLILLATALLTSPNFPGPSRELLVARFYANEVHFAHAEIVRALTANDRIRAQAAWEFGRDSWNSYFQVVNKAIVPKVGEPFPIIPSLALS
jgi:hypothetical protein